MLEASRRFAMTQSAVSQAVRRAEQAIGVEFFDRSRRPLTMTRAGRILGARVADLNRDFDTLLVDLRAAAALPERADLRLGLVDSYAGTVGAYLVKELVTGSTALSLSAWSGLAQSHAEALMRRTIDAAITCDAMEDLDDIERYPFYREPYLLVVPRDLESEFARAGSPGDTEVDPASCDIVSALMSARRSNATLTGSACARREHLSSIRRTV